MLTQTHKSLYPPTSAGGQYQLPCLVLAHHCSISASFLLATSVLSLTPRPRTKLPFPTKQRALELLPLWSFACSQREARFASSSTPFLSDQSWLARATLNPTLHARCQTLQCRAICGRGCVFDPVVLKDSSIADNPDTRRFSSP